MNLFFLSCREAFRGPLGDEENLILKDLQRFLEVSSTRARKTAAAAKKDLERKPKPPKGPITREKVYGLACKLAYQKGSAGQEELNLLSKLGIFLEIPQTLAFTLQEQALGGEDASSELLTASTIFPADLGVQSLENMDPQLLSLFQSTASSAPGAFQQLREQVEQAGGRLVEEPASAGGGEAGGVAGEGPSSYPPLPQVGARSRRDEAGAPPAADAVDAREGAGAETSSPPIDEGIGIELAVPEGGPTGPGARPPGPPVDDGPGLPPESPRGSATEPADDGPDLPLERPRGTATEPADDGPDLPPEKPGAATSGAPEPPVEVLGAAPEAASPRPDPSPRPAAGWGRQGAGSAGKDASADAGRGGLPAWKGYAVFGLGVLYLSEMVFALTLRWTTLLPGFFFLHAGFRVSQGDPPPRIAGKPRDPFPAAVVALVLTLAALVFGVFMAGHGTRDAGLAWREAIVTLRSHAEAGSYKLAIREARRSLELAEAAPTGLPRATAVATSQQLLARVLWADLRTNAGDEWLIQERYQRDKEIRAAFEAALQVLKPVKGERAEMFSRMVEDYASYLEKSGKKTEAEDIRAMDL